MQWLVCLSSAESCWKRLSFSTHDHYYVTLCPFSDANSLATTNDISAYSIRHLKKMSSFTSVFYSIERVFFRILTADCGINFNFQEEEGKRLNSIVCWKIEVIFHSKTARISSTFTVAIKNKILVYVFPHLDFSRSSRGCCICAYDSNHEVWYCAFS